MLRTSWKSADAVGVRSGRIDTSPSEAPATAGPASGGRRQSSGPRAPTRGSHLSAAPAPVVPRPLRFDRHPADSRGVGKSGQRRQATAARDRAAALFHSRVVPPHGQQPGSWSEVMSSVSLLLPRSAWREGSLHREAVSRSAMARPSPEVAGRVRDCWSVRREASREGYVGLALRR